MAEQGKGLVEGAVGARKGLVVVHVALVLAEVGGEGEGLPTVGEAVGPLARVGADVLVVVRGPGVGFWHRRGTRGAARPCAGSGAAAACPGASRLGPAVHLPVAQQVAGLLEGLPALQALVRMLLQGGRLQTPRPNGLCAGESWCLPGDMAGVTISGHLPRFAAQGHCSVLGATGPGCPSGMGAAGTGVPQGWACYSGYGGLPAASASWLHC